MHRNNVSLRLPPHLLDRLKALAKEESISVNQLVTVTVAVAEKLARFDAEALYRTRKGRSVAGAGWRALERISQNLPPVQDDEPPAT